MKEVANYWADTPLRRDTMTIDPVKSQGDSEVFRFGGFGTVLLISLLAFIGLYPLLLGETAGRLAGGLILAVILVSSAVSASRSRTHHIIGIGLAIFALALQAAWLETHNITLEAMDAAIFAIFFLYTALLIFRHVLSFGPVYADRVHAALSVYILLALSWAFIYGLIEIISPGAFLLAASSANAAARPQGAYLLADMIHFSVATLTSAGYGDITPVAPFARSMSQLEQLVGVFYIAVLISRLVGLYPSNRPE
jgi:Ion channel